MTGKGKRPDDRALSVVNAAEEPASTGPSVPRKRRITLPFIAGRLGPWQFLQLAQAQEKDDDDDVD